MDDALLATLLPDGPPPSITELAGWCGPLELAALRELEQASMRARGIDAALAAVTSARDLEALPLPDWGALCDLDRGCALMYLHQVQTLGVEYAVENYPARFQGDPRLAALPSAQACRYASRFARLAEHIDDDEHNRLYDLAERSL